MDDPMAELISITEAAAQGIERVRKPVWRDPCAHLKIDISDGRPGPWLHLYDPFNKKCNGRDPVDFLGIHQDYKAKEFLPYAGPTADSDDYKKAVAQYAGLEMDDLGRGK